jgi:hypothetical protein
MEGVSDGWPNLLPLQEVGSPDFRPKEKRVAGGNRKGAPAVNRGTPQPSRRSTSTAGFRFGLPAEAPHETALYSQVVLTSATKVSVEIIDLDGSQGNVPRQGDIGPAARSHGKRVA